MEVIFGKHGYEFIERLIFLLIFIVLAMLLVEFSFDKFLKHKEVKAIESYYEVGRTSALQETEDSAKIKAKLDSCIIGVLYGKNNISEDNKNVSSKIKIDADIEGHYIILKFKNHINSMNYFAWLDLIACIIFLAEYFLRLHR